MVTYQEAARHIKTAIDRDGRIPDSMEYVIHEPDPDGEQANVSLPFIEISILDVSRDDMSNTTYSGDLVTDSGDVVGKLYETLWEMQLQIDIWTADGSDYDTNRLGAVVRAALFEHDSRGPATPFVDGDGNAVDTMWDFQLLGGSREDDLESSHTVRRWRQRAQLRGAERYRDPGADPIRQTDQTIDT